MTGISLLARPVLFFLTWPRLRADHKRAHFARIELVDVPDPLPIEGDG